MKCNYLFIYLSVLLLSSCSMSEKMTDDDELTQDYYGSDMYISESSDEEGVVELVIPEMNEYSDIKKKEEQEAKLEKMELGSEDELTLETSGILKSTVEEVVDEEFNPNPVRTKIAIAADFSDDELSSDELSNDESKFEEYIVQRGDTLMLISFKLYRNFDRWKEIKGWNEDLFARTGRLKYGRKIKVKITGRNGKEWKPVGNPYLIQRGDYLGLVSKKVYDTAKYWRQIWSNNKLLILNPNKIYAGFTIYTPEIEGHSRSESDRSFAGEDHSSEL